MIRYVACCVVVMMVLAFLMANSAKPLERSPGRESYNRERIGSSQRLLQTGDIVLRMGNDITSYMLSRMNQTNKTFSHCGIVIIENGYPFVYHSIGGEDNPDEELRRDSAQLWFSPVYNLGFGIARFDINEEQRSAVVETVKLFYAEKRRFDMKFDLASDDRLYCSEFVYKVIKQVMKDSVFIKPITALGYHFVGVDNVYLNERTKLICSVKFK